MKINSSGTPPEQFAAACYTQNTIEDLEVPHAPEDADPVDLETWGITAEEWSDAIKAALYAKWSRFGEEKA